VKKAYLNTMIALFILCCTNGIQAQTTQGKLNQVELLKQFNGTWKTDITIDTITTIECNPYGNGQDMYMKTETNGKITSEARALIGYDKERDILIEAYMMKNNPEVYLYARWFISQNTLQEIYLKDISNPEQAIYKWTLELLSSNSFIVTKTENNIPIGKYTFYRKK
jgi:hypothetical protein